MSSSLDRSLEDFMSAIDVNDVDGAGVVTPGFSREIKAVLCEQTERPLEITTASNNQGAASNSDFSQVVILRDYCLRLWGSTCSRCELFCPQQAITLSLDAAVTIESARCNGCGICVGVCDVFVMPGFGLAELHGRIRAKQHTLGEVFITCRSGLDEEGNLAESVEILPSLAMLSPEFLAHLLIEGTNLSIAGDVAALFDESHGGSMAEMLFEHAITLAEMWSEKKVGYREVVPQALYEKPAENERYRSRRECFDDVMSLLASGKGISQPEVNSAHQEVLERRHRIFTRKALMGFEAPRINAFMAGNRLKQVMWPKRRLLLECVLACQDIEARVMLQWSDTDTKRCVDCLACVEACPPKARYAHPGDGLLEFDIRYCIGCGLCAEVCPTEAISLEISLPDKG